jgi:protocatechuate 3,4-dioxygenase beta subunit
MLFGRLRSMPLFATLLAIFLIARRTSFFDPDRIVTRKTLFKLAGLGAATLASGIWHGRRLANAAVISPSELGAACILSPEQTEGPYYIAREKVRSTISEHRAGTPLKLQFTVVDATTCKPIKGAAVDIWHCDAGGIYSGFESASTGGPPGGNSGPTDKHTFLRGIQLTGLRGRCHFQTVYPGWYRGRTVHIHVKVHVAGDVINHVVHTGQLFFSDTLTGKVYQNHPYRARAAARDTFNNTDSIFQSGGKQSLLTMRRDGHGGFVGSIVLGVRRA